MSGLFFVRQWHRFVNEAVFFFTQLARSNIVPPRQRRDRREKCDFALIWWVFSTFGPQSDHSNTLKSADNNHVLRRFTSIWILGALFSSWLQLLSRLVVLQNPALSATADNGGHLPQVACLPPPSPGRCEQAHHRASNRTAKKFVRRIIAILTQVACTTFNNRNPSLLTLYLRFHHMNISSSVGATCHDIHQLQEAPPLPEFPTPRRAALRSCLHS